MRLLIRATARNPSQRPWSAQTLDKFHVLLAALRGYERVPRPQYEFIPVPRHAPRRRIAQNEVGGHDRRRRTWGGGSYIGKFENHYCPIGDFCRLRPWLYEQREE
jgi:hypothetical protein